MEQLTISAVVTVVGSVNITSKRLNITATGALNGLGGGYKPGLGPGSRAYRAGQGGAGGAHAGCGSEPTATTCPLTGTPRVYGDAFFPTDQGSGGAPCCGQALGSTYYAGSGGAALRIIASQTLGIEGYISVEGQTPASDPYAEYSGGGGAGGSVWITAGTLLNSGGSIKAGGGAGEARS